MISRRIKSKFIKFNKLLDKLPWVKVSREIASCWDLAADKGIDFGDLSFNKFAWYYLRDHNCRWMYPLLSHRAMREEHERHLILMMYE